MDPLSDHEVGILASFKNKPMDFETYPPGFQAQCLAEYLIERGAVSFTVQDIQDLFRCAELKKALSDQPNRPAPNAIRKHIDSAINNGRLPLIFDEDSDCWLVQYPVFRIVLRIEVSANDAIHAKETVKSKIALGNRVVNESVTRVEPWVVTFELVTKFTSRTAVVGELIELISTEATEWTAAFANGEIEFKSTGRPRIGRFQSIAVKLTEWNSGAQRVDGRE